MSNKYELDDDEIDLKEIFRTLANYKFLILFFVILFGLLATIFAYFKPNVYTTATTIEIGIGIGGGGNDIVSKAISQVSEVNPDTEIEILKSRSLMVEAVKDVDFSHRYYTTTQMKKEEIYQDDSPFEVNLTKGFNQEFTVYPYDDTHYRLEQKSWNINYICAYGEKIVDDRFLFTLTLKKNQKLYNKKYSFEVLDLYKTVKLGQGHLKIKVAGKYTTIIEITKNDKVKKRAPKFTNALAEAYIKQSIEKRTREASKTLSFVDVELQKITDEVKKSAVKLENFKKKIKTVDLGTKSTIIMKRLGDMEIELSQLNIEINMVDSLYKRVKSGKRLESMLINGIFSKENLSLSRVISLLQKSMIELRTLKMDYTNDYPEVIKIRKEIKQTKNIIILMVKNFKKNLTDRKIVLEKYIKSQQNKVEKLAEDEQIYNELERKFKLNEKIYSYLLEKQASSAMTKASTVSRNRVLDKALYAKKTSPNRILITLVGLFLGFIVGAMIAFVRNFLDDTIKSIDDIRKGTNAVVLGIMPSVEDIDKDANIGSLKVFNSPRSSFTESFRNIRSNLKFMMDDNSSKVLTVTSTVGGEGKTTISSNLAGIISLTQKKVIIINLDMRKPTLHLKFNLPNNRGISSVLSGYQHLSDVIQETTNPYLDILSSGAVPPNPSELIHSKKMEEVIEELKKSYDIVILDTPPSGLVTDAQLLMRMSDSVIYVVRANYAKKDFLKNIDYLANEDDISGFSIILNDIDTKDSGHGYGYGYGYGYYEED
jgi:capsular exopolysaccharide synthesis family protein